MDLHCYTYTDIPNHTGNGSLNRERHLALPGANELNNTF